MARLTDRDANQYAIFPPLTRVTMNSERYYLKCIVHVVASCVKISLRVDWPSFEGVGYLLHSVHSVNARCSHQTILAQNAMCKFHLSLAKTLVTPSAAVKYQTDEVLKRIELFLSL